MGSDFCEKIEIAIRSWTENENKFQGIRIRVIRLGTIRNKISDESVSQNKESIEKRENKKSNMSHKLIKGNEKKEIELDKYKEFPSNSM